MYLNRAQKYILELLRKYGALKKSQLEIMARYDVSEHLQNLNGYLKQLSQWQEIDVLLCGENDAYICLPGTQPNDDLIDAFDVVGALRGRMESHCKGVGRVQIRFDFKTDEGRINDAFVIVVHPGTEQEIAEYADRNFSNEFQTVFFLCYKKTQMKNISSTCNHIFAVNVKGDIQFFQNT